ncbi:MAG: YqzL family protein [Bacilli bacterium]|nr:YqzL family protein [Bacilli bacterium]
MKDLLWTLFKKTGDIKYYLMYNELRGNDGNDRGNSTK